MSPHFTLSTTLARALDLGGARGVRLALAGAAGIGDGLNLRGRKDTVEETELVNLAQVEEAGAGSPADEEVGAG